MKGARQLETSWARGGIWAFMGGKVALGNSLGNMRYSYNVLQQPADPEEGYL